MYTYRARVTKVIDADTVDVDVDLGMHVHTFTRLRVNGVNAPEVSTDTGRAARDWARGVLPVGLLLTITTARDPTDKYGRWLAAITMPDGGDFAARLVDAGHGVVWDGKGLKPGPPNPRQ